MTGLLADRTAVVTGGSSGIGRAISITFAEQGASVIIADLSQESNDSEKPTAEYITDDIDGEAVFVQCDVSDLDAIDRVVDSADQFGGIDVLVNNAGLFRVEDVFSVCESEFEKIIDVNLKGTFFFAQKAAARMKESGGGSIINISSVNGLIGNGSYPTYCASKGGVTSLTYALADAFGPENIRVNAIHPGPTDTDMTKELHFSDAFLEAVPAGRVGTPNDIAGTALFLASDLASYVTGESLVVDGGYSSTG